jgi:hypothetical protein
MHRRTVLAIAATSVAIIGTTIVAGAAVSGATVLGFHHRHAIQLVEAAAVTPRSQDVRVVTKTEYENHRVVVTTAAPASSTAPVVRSAPTATEPSETLPPITGTPPTAPLAVTSPPARSSDERSDDDSNADPPATNDDAPAPTVPTSTTPATTVTLQTAAIDTTAGTIHVQFDATSLTVTGVDPDAGYHFDVSGSGTHASVHFESQTREVDVHLSVQGGQLHSTYDD